MQIDLDTLEDGPVPGLRGTTYYRVHKAILSDIVNGTFAPGSRLKIAELCKRYGLSQMPIREALQLLQGEGFVVMSPNKGASVRPITRKFLTDIYDVRGALYAIVYRDVIASADAAFDHTLVDIQKRFDAAVEDNDARSAQAMNRLLHSTIEALCSNAEVSKLSRKYADLTSSCVTSWVLTSRGSDRYPKNTGASLGPCGTATSLARSQPRSIMSRWHSAILASILKLRTKEADVAVDKDTESMRLSSVTGI